MKFSQTGKFFLNRIMISMITMLLLSAGLVYNLMVMQVEKSGHYSKLADSNRLRFAAVPPPRGVFYDRSGYPLAANRTFYHLEMTPSLVDDPDETLQGLRRVMALEDKDFRRFEHRFAKQSPSGSVILKTHLSEEELARFAVDQHLFPGVEVVGELGRYYPHRGIFSHAVGYVGAASAKDLKAIEGTNYRGLRYTGKVGLEKKYEELLRGKPGVRVFEADAQGRFIRDISKRSSQPGHDILLTLDRKLQMAAYRAISDYEGAVVALDPRNGDVLAMVSSPVFDPNDFFRGFDSGEYRKMLDSPRRYFFDRAISGQYSPGSTIKPIVALSGLRHGVTSNDYYMYAGPYFSLPGHTRRFHDWKPAGHGWVNLRDSITRSCDVYFYDLAHRIGINRLHDVFVSFGFGSPSGLDTVNEAVGLVPSSRWKRAQLQMPWFEEETVITGIGQGYLLVTPMQLAVAVATIANRGVRMRPRLIKAIRKDRSKDWELNQPEVAGTVDFSAESWQLVVDAMIDAVHKPDGTAYRIGADAHYVMAGKTGTVQTYSISEEERMKKTEVTSKTMKDHSIFIAFAPADNPTIAIAVVVEHVGSGSKYAAPMARQLLDVYFEQSTAAHDIRGINSG